MLKGLVSTLGGVSCWSKKGKSRIYLHQLIFQLSGESNLGSELLSLVMSQQDSRHLFNQSGTKLKPLATWPFKFSALSEVCSFFAC